MRAAIIILMAIGLAGCATSETVYLKKTSQIRWSSAVRTQTMAISLVQT